MKEELRKSISGKMLKTILPLLIATGAILLIAHLLEKEIEWLRFFITLFMILVLILSYWINHKGKTILSAAVLTFLSLSFLFFGMYLNGGIRSAGFIALPFVLVSSVLFFNNLITLILYAIIFTYTGLLLVLENRGILTQINNPSAFYTWITGIIILGFLVIMVKASFQQVEENVKIREMQADKLEQKELLTRIVFDSVSDALVSVDPYGHIMRYNLAAQSSFSSGEITEKESFSRVFILSTEEGIPYHLPMDLQTPIHRTPLLLHRNKMQIPVMLSGEPLVKGSELYLGMIITIRDMTKEKEIQNQLIQSQKMEAIGQLASGVAHDFNNMLGGILVASDELEEKLTGEDLEMVHIIQKAGDRASRLTRQLLDFSHKGKLVSSSVNVHDVINDALQMLKQTLDRSIKLETSLEAEQSYVIGDDNQIINSLVNMAINSSHAMPGGGTLRFSTANVFLNEDYCRKAISELYPGDYIRIDIIDSGTGIHPEKLPRIFDPFFTTKKQGEGTGLGLAAVKGMVESHKGTMTVYSELGKGTSFHIYLPIGEIKNEGTSGHHSLLEGKGQHILVIDDEDIIRVTVKVMLENLKYHVCTAANGEEGLQMIEENVPDLIILDMIMPGMNGREVFRLVREKHPDMPVLLASGFSKESDVREMRSKNLSGFIRKPFTKTELGEELKRILG